MSEKRIIIVMVGLPGRGKTFISTRLKHYMEFFHNQEVRTFRYADYRRRTEDEPNAAFLHSAPGAQAVIQEACERALADLVKWFGDGEFVRDGTPDRARHARSRGPTGEALGKAAIIDGNNHTVARREWLRRTLRPLRCRVVWVESIVSDDALLLRNLKETICESPDFQQVPEQERVTLFKRRCADIEQAYEPIRWPSRDGKNMTATEMGDDEPTLITITNGRNLRVMNVHGPLVLSLVQFLTHMHKEARPIYLSRHGQSEYNAQGRIGGNSGLTAYGRAYAEKLAEFARDEIVKANGDSPVRCRLWTSSLRRTIETASGIRQDVPPYTTEDGKPWIQMNPKRLRSLDEIYAGDMDGYTYEEIEEKYPEEFRARSENKLTYRYPRGESYLDLIHRIHVPMVSLSRVEEPVLIVAHQAVLRLIYCFLTGRPREQAPSVKMELNKVLKLTQTSIGCDEELFDLTPETGKFSPRNEPPDPPSH